MSKKQTDGDKLEEACKDLETRYKDRHFDGYTKNMAAQFLIRCYAKWKDESDASRMDEKALRYLTLGAEIADYFNILNESLGTQAGEGAAAGASREGALYGWITSLSQDLLGQVLALAAGPQELAGKELNLLNERIRFCAAVAINEKYRQSEYRYCLENLPPLIGILERTLAPLTARCEELQRASRSSTADARSAAQMLPRLEHYKLAYEDTLSYLYFLSAKCARQSHSYRKAIDDASRSTEYLLSGALSLTSSPADAKSPPDADVKLAHFRLCRVGVTDLARSWTYLAWGRGRIDAAELVGRRAWLLINEKDGLNYHLAKSINGIIKRIKAGKADKEQLDEAVELLSSSYEYFCSFPFPRYAVRCLFELCLAYLLKGELVKAAKLLLGVSARPDKDALRLLLDKPRWRVQTHLLLSQIARRDKGRKAVALLSGAGWFVRRASNKRRDLLQLAIDEAERAWDLAKRRELRTAALEALIYLGEAHLSLAEELNQSTRGRKDGDPKDDDSLAPYIHYEKARAAFTRAAGLSAPSDPAHARREELSPAGGETNVEQLALCKLYLAEIEIAVKSNESVGRARAYLEEYDALLPIEHGWIKELEMKVRRNLADLQNRFIIIPYDDHHSYRQIEANYYVALADRLNIDGRKISDVAKRLGVSRDTVYNIRKRAEAARSEWQQTDSDE
jgi:hypothetical protein